MNGNVLIVDDDPVILNLLGDAVEQFGHRADKAGDADQAIAMLEEETYDILILDKNMPGQVGDMEGGMRVLQYLRKQGLKTEAIMITGHATVETAIEAMRLGAFDYIIKPFSLNVLKEKIDRILEFRHFINPAITIKSFKEFHNELLNLFENRCREINPDTDRAIQALLTKVEHFFTVQRERERIMISQRETLAEIACTASEFRDRLAEEGTSHDLLEKICLLADRRI